MSNLRIDTMRMARRNKLVGMWAANKLNLIESDTKTYSDDLAKAAFDVNQNDILAKIRSDFDAAGIVQSDEEILAMMNQCWLNAGNQSAQSSDTSDGALVQIARNLMR
ncbi:MULTISPECIES: ATPase inhibitor subunit zeta [unclassified Rhizobium]|uniref:ATPase inhibitor subunit zeta n=1 Tax=unclassified Rhizobium TaxID=2613769 RepID=UPI0017BCB4F7|nr:MULTISPECIES: ATPase inhibitor subunit zeta [unclassified Rhizobium]MBB3319374.1 hypothetical protein [Rhizobium sp. BK181]MBB3542883.1 hypothetical protein [Rhizobium sp. BK399]MCS4095044.1 hypothetical protein [Rhizobium sp. BK176]